MDENKWFSDENVIQKSKKAYAHFDLRTNVVKARKYITNPDKIKHHGFYPFIKYVMRYDRFHKVNGRNYQIFCVNSSFSQIDFLIIYSK